MLWVLHRGDGLFCADYFPCSTVAGGNLQQDDSREVCKNAGIYFEVMTGRSHALISRLFGLFSDFWLSKSLNHHQKLTLGRNEFVGSNEISIYPRNGYP